MPDQEIQHGPVQQPHRQQMDECDCECNCFDNMDINDKTHLCICCTCATCAIASLIICPGSAGLYASCGSTYVPTLKGLGFVIGSSFATFIGMINGVKKLFKNNCYS